MKNTFWILLPFAFAGCSHFNEAPKQVQFAYASDLLKSIQNSAVVRAPASTPLEAEEEKSTRRVYFSSLYHQYMTLGEHLGKKQNITFCPQFHHDKVEADSFNVPLISHHKGRQVDEGGRVYFPELAFNKNFSLKDYHEVIKGELLTLCEEGVSDNFYKYDNLVTHYAHKTDFHMKPTAMEAVLKIPIFANFYLLKMMENQSQITFTHPEEKRFIQLARTHWFDRYVSEASRQRERFLRNKMVQR